MTNIINFGIPILEFTDADRVGAQYRLLEDHYISDRFLLAGTTVTEGAEIPFGWIPSPNVEPLNALAVNDFYAAGPTDLGLVRQQFTLTNVPRPVTYWAKVITQAFVPDGTSTPVNPMFFGIPILNMGQAGAGGKFINVFAANLWFLTGLGAGLPPIPAVIPHPVRGYPQ